MAKSKMQMRAMHAKMGGKHISTMVVGRSKSSWPSARSAWLDIAKSGIPQSRIVGKAVHSSSKWQWRVKK